MIEPTNMLVDVEGVPVTIVLVKNEILQPAGCSVAVVEKNMSLLIIG